MSHTNLLGPDPTLLPEFTEAQAELDSGTDPGDVARAHPTFSAAWAALAERALEQGDPVAAYAYARTGYHRGLDQLRRAGWKGHGPVPWRHRPNQGFLSALAALALAAERIGEQDEFERCRQFLVDSDPEAAVATGLSGD
ncbi:DUF3151 domain-containing protein [Actinoalloteichus sp. AHMU CJ021]|uniref:DUF3151 family protein n=1 Tax=Actinoalloteichus caeruleus DSM 43889 TaxID=1120930 RepID=A0ABT1JKZ8_ACTCY|nr:DUF3151 domain-containing protein [Actinoalloteichus caeruleus]AUS78949.1 DUF3151 domain-containing protein [Actinoalloteichus sp. AHMU CJ021]MCP2333165.1 Protein of unknown function (DUF3151) [Actinoalloteichus caeruleus DSM 43889]